MTKTHPRLLRDVAEGLPWTTWGKIGREGGEDWLIQQQVFLFVN